MKRQKKNRRGEGSVGRGSGGWISKVFVKKMFSRDGVVSGGRGGFSVDLNKELKFFL